MTRPFHKFTADMCYGAMAAKSSVLSEIAQALQEDTQKINTVERLARNLNAEIPKAVQDNYSNVVQQYLPDNIVIHIDVEIQRADQGAGKKRARYYSSMLDSTTLHAS